MKKWIIGIFCPPPWIGFKKVEGAIMTITLKLANLENRYVLTILLFKCLLLSPLNSCPDGLFCLKKNNQCNLTHVKICPNFLNNSCGFVNRRGINWDTTSHLISLFHKDLYDKYRFNHRESYKWVHSNSRSKQQKFPTRYSLPSIFNIIKFQIWYTPCGECIEQHKPIQHGMQF